MSPAERDNFFEKFQAFIEMPFIEKLINLGVLNKSEAAELESQLQLQKHESILITMNYGVVDQKKYVLVAFTTPFIFPKIKLKPKIKPFKFANEDISSIIVNKLNYSATLFSLRLYQIPGDVQFDQVQWDSRHQTLGLRNSLSVSPLSYQGFFQGASVSWSSKIWSEQQNRFIDEKLILSANSQKEIINEFMNFFSVIVRVMNQKSSG